MNTLVGTLAISLVILIGIVFALAVHLLLARGNNTVTKLDLQVRCPASQTLLSNISPLLLLPEIPRRGLDTSRRAGELQAMIKALKEGWPLPDRILLAEIPETDASFDPKVFKEIAELAEEILKSADDKEWRESARKLIEIMTDSSAKILDAASTGIAAGAVVALVAGPLLAVLVFGLALLTEEEDARQRAILQRGIKELINRSELQWEAPFKVAYTQLRESKSIDRDSLLYDRTAIRIALRRWIDFFADTIRTAPSAHRAILVIFACRTLDLDLSILRAFAPVHRYLIRGMCADLFASDRRGELGSCSHRIHEYSSDLEAARVALEKRILEENIETDKDAPIRVILECLTELCRDCELFKRAVDIMLRCCQLTEFSVSVP